MSIIRSITDTLGITPKYDSGNEELVEDTPNEKEPEKVESSYTHNLNGIDREVKLVTQDYVPREMKFKNIHPNSDNSGSDNIHTNKSTLVFNDDSDFSICVRYCKARDDVLCYIEK